MAINLGMGAPVALGGGLSVPGAVPLVTAQTRFTRPVTPVPAADAQETAIPFRLVPTQSFPGMQPMPRMGGVNEDGRTVRGRPDAPQQAAMDLVTTPIPQAEVPDAPAPQQPMPASGRAGGLGGLGGVSWGDRLSALGRSMMSSPNGWWTGQYGANMQAARERRAQEEQRATQMRAMEGALRELGFSPDEARAYAGTPEAAQLVMQARERARERQERERMLSGAEAMERGLMGGGMAMPAGPQTGQPAQGGGMPALGSPEALGLPPGALGGEGGGNTPAPAPAAPGAPAAAAQPAPAAPDPMAQISFLNSRIRQYSELAARYEAAGNPVGAARAQAFAEQFAAERDLLADRLPPVDNEQDAFRPATPEEAAVYGAQFGQINTRTGRFFPADPGENEVIYGPDGRPILVRGNPDLGATFTESQSKDNVFSTRARGALEVLDSMVGEGDAAMPLANVLTSRADRLGNAVPFGFGREFQSEDFQVAEQAGQEFLQAILRKDTGAAITAQEQELYGQTYLPQPGDGPRVLEAKAAARQRAIAAIEAGMSPAQMLAQERALRRSAGEGEAETDTPPPEGISPEDWRYMTPEERSLWQN